MPDYIDFGTRCETHAGEVFPPRCGACEKEAASRMAPASVGECPLHVGYMCGGVFGRCPRCERDSDHLERRSIHHR